MAAKPEQEFSIEEILASIRQIISDDDQPRESDLELTQGPDEKFAIPVAAADDDLASFDAVDDVLDLTEEVAPEPRFTIPQAEDEPRVTDFVIPPEIAPAPRPVSAPPTGQVSYPTEKPVSAPATESVFSGIAADATSAAFSRLVGNMSVERDDNRQNYAGGRITLEDVVRDLLRPMLRDWIDTNVPRMVERLVEKELEKLARAARDD